LNKLIGLKEKLFNERGKTNVLVWNWCPVNDLMVGPVSWFGTSAL